MIERFNVLRDETAVGDYWIVVEQATGEKVAGFHNDQQGLFKALQFVAEHNRHEEIRKEHQ